MVVWNFFINWKKLKMADRLLLIFGYFFLEIGNFGRQHEDFIVSVALSWCLIVIERCLLRINGQQILLDFSFVLTRISGLFYFLVFFINSNLHYLFREFRWLGQLIHFSAFFIVPRRKMRWISCLLLSSSRESTLVVYCQSFFKFIVTAAWVNCVLFLPRRQFVQNCADFRKLFIHRRCRLFSLLRLRPFFHVYSVVDFW